MKKLLSLALVLAIIASLFAAFPAYAATSGTCGTNLTWTLNNGTLTISGTGAMTDWTSYSSVPWYSSRGSINTVVINDGVTSIGNSAFLECSSLTSITIPDGVTSIGNDAFYKCTSLTSVVIPDSVTTIGDVAFYKCTSLTSITVDASNEYYCSVDGNLFTKDKKTLVRYAIGKTAASYTIPDGVTTIGDYAFEYCTSLTSVVIGDGVTSIGYGAFSNCTSLTSIVIPDGVTSIGNDAFYKCTSLTSIAIPDSVTTIGRYAFEYCTSLTSIVIPDSVTTIGNDAFSDCTSLTSVVIPDSVTIIGSWAFRDCTSLTSIVIPDGVTTIGEGAFEYCTSLTSIVIPDSVTTIGNWAFCGCTSLTSIVIPDSVTTIGNGAFSYCTSLTDVYYGGSQDDRKKISIGSSNTRLTNATWHYNWTGEQEKAEISFNTVIDNTGFGYLGLDWLGVYEMGYPIEATLESDDYTTDDISWSSSDTSIFTVTSTYPGWNEKVVRFKIDAKKPGTATLTGRLPDGSSASVNVKISQVNELEVKEIHGAEYLYLNGAFLSSDEDVTTTPEIYLALKNKLKLDNYTESEPGKNSLHDLKLRATVSGGNLSFDKNSYTTTYESTFSEIKLNESLFDLLLLYPYNVNDNTFATARQYSVNVTITCDELESPYNETLGFTVKNYEDFVVDAHIDFIDNNSAYKALKNNDAEYYGDAVKNNSEYKWNNFLFNLATIDNLLKLNDPYEIMVADVMSEYLGSEQVEHLGMSLFLKTFAGTYEEILSEVWDTGKDLKSAASDLSGVIDTMVKDEYVDLDFKLKPNAIEKFLKSSKYTDEGVNYKDNEFFTLVGEKLGTASNQSKINKVFAACDKVGQAWKLANTGIKVPNDIIDGINYTTMLNAYYNADKYTKSAVEATLAEVARENSSNERLKNALARYVFTETDFDRVSESILIGVRSGYRAAYHIYKGVFSSQVKAGIWAAIGQITVTYGGKAVALGSVPAASAAGGALAGWEAGKGLSDVLCSGSNKADEMKKVVILGEISHYAGTALYRAEEKIKNERTQESIAYYEPMLKFFKALQTESLDHMMEINNLKAYSIIEYLFADYKNDVVSVNQEFASDKKLYESIWCHGWKDGGETSSLSPRKSSVKVIQVKCPVDVCLYSLSDELLVQITDNEVAYAANNVAAYVYDKTKYIIVPAEQEFKVSIVATDNGVMNYSVTEYDSGEAVRKINFDDITLYEDRVFDGELKAGYEVKEESYALSSETAAGDATVINYSEVYSGDDLQSLSVEVSCEGGGAARGVANATVGDYVVVLAEPDDDAVFVGWYGDDGELVSKAETYGFIIRKSLDLTAKFVNEKESKEPMSIEISGLADGGRLVIAQYTKDGRLIDVEIREIESGMQTLEFDRLTKAAVVKFLQWEDLLGLAPLKAAITVIED